MKSKLFLTMMLLLSVVGLARGQETLTVYDGTATNSNVPVHGNWADAYLKCEFVIPADQLTAMTNCEISKMTFYLSSPASAEWTGTFQVFLKEVNDATISAYTGTDGATIVYEGTLDATGTTMDVVFDTNYIYEGGNLLVGVYQTVKGVFKSAAFYGETVTGASVQGYNSSSLDAISASQKNFIPKTTFTYSPSSGVIYHKPTALIVSDLTTNVATISWTAPEGTVTGYTYQYKKASEDEWGAEANTTETTVTLNGLTAATAYNFRVKAVYSDGESGFATVKFTTEFDAQSLPYEEGFESGIGAWTLVSCASSTGINSGAKKNGSYGFQFSYNTTPPQYLISPEFEVSAEAVEVAFYYKNPSSYTETFMVGYSTTTKDVDAFTWEDEVTAPANWTEYNTVFPAGTKYVAIKYTANNQYKLYLDDFSFMVASPYKKPTDLAVSEIKTSSAVLDWTEKGSSTQWVVGYKADADADFTEENADVKPFTLTGLTPETQYTVKVRPIEDDTKWSDVITFTTLAAYPAPTNLAASGVTKSSAVLDWTENGISTQWVVGYKADADADFTEENADVKPFTLTGLTPETQYTVKVRPIEDDTKWSATINFTTLPSCPAPTGLAVTLTPGDGTVAELSWTENGTATAWQICLDGDEDHLVAADSNPFTLTGLTPETAIAAKVRAVGEGEFSSWSNEVTFTPTDAYTLTVNDGTNTNSYIPFYGYYADSNADSQFIIPASDLTGMQWGTIEKITFYSSTASAAWNGAVYDVYFTEVNNTEFESAAFVDWTSMEKVYTGSVSVVNNEMEITLSAPYQYLGGNLLIGFDETTNSTNYPQAPWYGLTQSSNTAVYKYGSNSAKLATFLPKTTFNFVPGVAPSCAKPTGLAVNYTGGNTAVVSWTSDAGAWNIDVNGTVTPITENPYTLTGLAMATAYEVKVQADCGSGSTSDWTNAVSFTTDLCTDEDKCLITFELTDQWGDSWNGNAIKVVDVETGFEVGQVANENLNGTTGSGENELNIITLAVCPGREIRFEWVTGSYPGEASYVVKDVNEEVIFSGSGAMSAPVTYLVDCTTTQYRIPSDLTASEIGSRSVELSWTENSLTTVNSWVVAYKADGDADFTEVIASVNPFTLNGLTPETQYTVKVRPETTDAIKWSVEITFTTDVAFAAPHHLTADNITSTSADISWTSEANVTGAELQYAEGSLVSNTNWNQYDDGSMQTQINAGGSAFNYAVMFPAGSYTGNALTKVSLYDYAASTGTITIYNDGDTNPDNELASMPYTFTGANDFIEVNFGTLAIDDTKNVWVVVTNPDGVAVPAAADNLDDANGRWVSMGTWEDLASAVPGYCWMVRAEIGAIVDPSTLTWTTKTDVTSPCELTGLTPETEYVVRVKAIYGTDGESAWTVTSFKTLEANPVPYNIVADLVADGGTLTWNGSGDSYNVRFRTAENENAIFFDDFENGLNNWTVIRNGAEGTDNTDWHVVNSNTVFSNGAIPAHSGDYVAMSRSYAGSAYNVDNWLISPKLTLDGTLKFWVMDDGQYHEHYDVYVSTTTNDIDAFTLLNSPGDASDAWTEVSVDLSSYAGQQGYIALRNTDNDQDFLFIDDFGIYGASTPAGAWQDMVVTDVTATLSGLDTNNGYEYQVQSVLGGITSDWSDVGEFALLTLKDDGTTDNFNLLFNNRDRLASVTLDRTLYKDNSWNTLTVPFEATIAGGPLDGAVAKTLADAEVTGSTTKLTFGAEVDDLEAGVPYLIKWADGSDLAKNDLVFNNVVIDDTDRSISLAGGDVKFIGYYDAFEINKPGEPTNEDIYYMTADNKLKNTTKTRTLKGLRAYFQFAGDVSSSRSFVLNFGDDVVPTNISNLSEDQFGNGDWYTVSGMKVGDTPMKKGVYIKNGKKVVIK